MYARIAVLMVLMLSTVAGFAQQFEGTMKWSMQSEIKDPRVRAQMEQAKKQSADPAAQARMKEMQAKMDDPEFKKMMDANPQMKAQMEQAMKMMQGGGMEDMIPKGMVVKIKGKNSISHMDGGMMTGDILRLSDKDQSYYIDRDKKTYYVMNAGSSSGKKQEEAKVTKTSETASILGYTCTKYLAEITERGKTITQSIWATTEISGLDFNHFGNSQMSGGRNVSYAGIEGVPLKVEVDTPEAKMVMEAVEIKPGKIDDAEFVLPADYQQVQGMMGMGMH